MSTPAFTAIQVVSPPAAARTRTIAIGLLGLGVVGTAVARQAGVKPGSNRSQPGVRPVSDPGPGPRISAALVRDTLRTRACALPDGALLTDDPREILARRPDVIVEVLGGREPARTLVSAALASGIPVVTANKSLLAAHGDDLLELSASAGTPLRYEAAVLAGVPFLGVPGRRAHAATLQRLTGIVNGTSNYILTRMRDERVDSAAALAEARRLGLAEPDPRHDIEGVDAAEKLAVLLRHYGRAGVDAAAIERVGLAALESADLEHAADFGGTIKPLAAADVRGRGIQAFIGPAFIPSTHALARVDGRDNAVIVENGYGTLVFAGPGAGPDATAATVLDDVLEIAAGGWREDPRSYEAPPRAVPTTPATAWFVRLTGPRLPSLEAIAALLGAHGIWVRRWSDADGRHGRAARWLLTLPAPRARIDRALEALRAGSGCRTNAIRALEAR